MFVFVFFCIILELVRELVITIMQDQFDQDWSHTYIYCVHNVTFGDLKSDKSEI